VAVLGIRVRSLREAAQRLLRTEPQRLVVPAAAALNTTIVFSE